MVTVDVNWPRRLPGILIQTFALRLDISIPTDRSWTMSIAVALSEIEGIGHVTAAGRAGSKSGIEHSCSKQQSTVPVEALHTTLKNGLNYGTKKSRRSPQ